MKYVNTHNYFTKVKRTKNKKNNLATIVVDEYKTIWFVSLYIIGERCPKTLDWKYSKKEYKTFKEVVKAHLKEAYDNGNI